MKNTPLLKMKGITKDGGIIINDGLILDGIRDSLNDEKLGMMVLSLWGGVTERDRRGYPSFPGCCVGGGGGSGNIITEKEIIL